MIIQLNSAGKRFNFEWILRNINYTFHSGKSYAILGPNGSGKSTFLQMIAGIISPSSGEIVFQNDREQLESENIFSHLTIAAPYQELIEEFTAAEMISFQGKFKPFLPGVSNEEVMEIALLKNESSKQIRNFSSGMKQRLKITLAVLADVPVVLLDEPTTNLDQQGFGWYLELLKKFSGKRLIVISSNLEREYSFCDDVIDVTLFKS